MQLSGSFQVIGGNEKSQRCVEHRQKTFLKSNRTVLRFFSTANDADGYIVRYEWYFGDGTSSSGAEGHIDVQKGYPNAGTYTVTHIVTDNVGAQAACFVDVTIVP